MQRRVESKVRAEKIRTESASKGRMELQRTEGKYRNSIAAERGNDSLFGRDFMLEVKLRMLLAAASQQRNQAELAHYVATLRGLLEHLNEALTSNGLSSLYKATVNGFSEKIEAIASKLVNPLDLEGISVKENPSDVEEKRQIPLSSRFRRRPLPTSSTEGRPRVPAKTDSAPVILDAAAQEHIEKQRKRRHYRESMRHFRERLTKQRIAMTCFVPSDTLVDYIEKGIEHILVRNGVVDPSKIRRLTRLVLRAMFCFILLVHVYFWKKK